MIGHRRVNGGHTRNVDNHHFGAVLTDTSQQLFGQLARALSVNDADDGQNQQTLANLEHRRGKFADRFLLLANDAFAFLHEAHRNGVGDAVGSRLVGVQHAVEQLEIGLIFFEQRTGEHVAQQQHDADDFVRFDAARNDSLGQAARVRLERFDTAGLEHFHIVVVHRRRFGENFLLAHRGEQLGVGDAAGPLFPELGAVLAQVRHQFAQQRGAGFGRATVGELSFVLFAFHGCLHDHLLLT